MELKLYRFSSGRDDTLGVLYEDFGIGSAVPSIKPPQGTKTAQPLAFTLEDEFRKEKVAGETRIPAGRYEIKFREVLSPMTQRYRERFPWFHWHLELQNVPGFTNVYIHVGNREDDTDGCIVVGSTCQLNLDENGFVGNSVETFKRIYQKIGAICNSNEKVFITIQDGFE